MSNERFNSDAALTALALYDAAIDHDNTNIDALMEPWLNNAAPVMQHLIWIGRQLLVDLTADPHAAIAAQRVRILEKIAEEDQQ